jgi:hypothetical protein
MTETPNDLPKASIAYICSPGHSGSTLLDMLVGSIPGAFSTGEQRKLSFQLDQIRDTVHLDKPSDALGPEMGKQMFVCSCLRDFRSCSFWRPVLDAVSEVAGYDICEDPMRFKLAVLTIDRGEMYWKHRPLLDMIRFRVPRAIAIQLSLALGHSGPWPSCWFGRRAVANTWLLADCIRKVHGVQCVVNSGKNLAEALLLNAYRRGSVKVIHLYRNFCGALASRLRWKPNATRRDLDAYLKQLLNYHIRVYKTCHRISDMPYLLVDYDAYTADPLYHRNRMAEFLGLPTSETPLHLNTTEFHLVSGNIMRFKGEIDIRPSISWRERLNNEQKAFAEEMTHRLPSGMKQELQSLSIQGT